MKKTTIESLLTWAFTQELPKIGAGSAGAAVAFSSWNVIADIAALGTMIDRNPNRYGAIPGYIDEGEPAHDALLVGEAVRALATMAVSRSPMAGTPFPNGPIRRASCARKSGASWRSSEAAATGFPVRMSSTW